MTEQGMSARVEAAAVAIGRSWTNPKPVLDTEVAAQALAAADAVMFDELAVEELERVLTMHHVITDGLEEGYGWCSQCGNVGDDNEAHLARAVIAALKGDDA